MLSKIETKNPFTAAQHTHVSGPLPQLGDEALPTTYLIVTIFDCNFCHDSKLSLQFYAFANQRGTVGILTTTASVHLDGTTSAVTPTDLAEVFSGASS